MSSTALKSRLSIVVVGNGMASHALLKRLVQLDAASAYRIVVIGEERTPAYDRVNLTGFFTGKTRDDLLLDTPDWYNNHGVQLVTGDAVTLLDRSAQVVRTRSGREFHYHYCIFATGSAPFVPPIEGTDLPGVFFYRTIDDLSAIRNYAEGCKSAAVLGGGLLGLEAAKALYDCNLQATVVEMAPALMPRQLDANSAKLLQDKIEALGVEVLTARRTQRISPAGDHIAIEFVRDETLSADMVVISAGIRPRDELARKSGLPCGVRGGVLVDYQLRTEDPRVFAIGECACCDDRLYGLVAPTYDMARVLAENLAAQATGTAADSRFHGHTGASRLKLLGIDVVTLGQAIGEVIDASLLTHCSENKCVSLLVRERAIVGAIGVGPWPEREDVSELISSGDSLASRQIARFERTGSLWGQAEPTAVAAWPASATVCSCLGITRGELTEARAAGANSVATLASATGASTVCGSCQDLLCQLVGDPTTRRQRRVHVALFAASLLALLIVPLYCWLGPLPVGDSVRSALYQTNQLMRDDFVKQITGYSLLSISALALLFSLRKRFAWFHWGAFANWRGAHGVLGCGTLIGFLMHTGLDLGKNLTFALASVFLFLNFLGGATGIAAAVEPVLDGNQTRWVREWRPRLTACHIYAFWPLPVLVLFHVISIYYY